MNRETYFRAKGVFVGLAFVVIGGFIVITVAGEWWVGMQSRQWKAVDAIVTVSREAQETVHGGDGTTHKVRALEFSYQYELAGTGYVSGGLSFHKKEVADMPQFLQTYPVGKKLTTYYNPKHPEHAVMQRGVPAVGILFIRMPAVFVLLGPFIVWGSITGAIVRFCERRGLWYR